MTYSFPVEVRILARLVDRPPRATAAEAEDSEASVRLTGNAMGELAAMNTNVSKVVLTVCISVPPDCYRKTATDRLPIEPDTTVSIVMRRGRRNDLIHRPKLTG